MVKWTPEEKRAEVLSAARRALVPLPDTRIIETPGWAQVITPSRPQGGMNEVYRAILNEEHADPAIAATIAEYEALGIQFRWTVGPDSRPIDLPERLVAFGLEPSPTWAMTLDVEKWIAPTIAPSITIELATLATLAIHDRTMASGWGMDPEPVGKFHRMLLEREAHRFAFFLARVDGEPAGTGSAVIFDRSLHLIGSVVLPPFRSRGVYRALVDARVKLALARSLSLITVHANAISSGPICARLGFEKLVDLPMFRYTRKEARRTA
jgi:hypothetical protein